MNAQLSEKWLIDWLIDWVMARMCGWVRNWARRVIERVETRMCEWVRKCARSDWLMELWRACVNEFVTEQEVIGRLRFGAHVWMSVLVSVIEREWSGRRSKCSTTRGNCRTSVSRLILLCHPTNSYLFSGLKDDFLTFLVFFGIVVLITNVAVSFGKCNDNYSVDKIILFSRHVLHFCAAQSPRFWDGEFKCSFHRCYSPLLASKLSHETQYLASTL